MKWARTWPQSYWVKAYGKPANPRLKFDLCSWSLGIVVDRSGLYGYTNPRYEPRIVLILALGPFSLHIRIKGFKNRLASSTSKETKNG